MSEPLEPRETQEQKRFESWAIVEVMGHNTYAGLVTEQTLAGTGFVRVDVPALAEGKPGYYQPARPAFTKLIGASSIYAITPCSEEVARKAAAEVRTRPVNMLELPTAGPRAIGAADDEE